MSDSIWWYPFTMGAIVGATIAIVIIAFSHDNRPAERQLACDCEYEYYKECINGSQGGPEGS